MTLNPRTLALRLLDRPGLNFWLTNRIPRRPLTLFMGWFARIEQPLVRSTSIALWRFFADVDLADARERCFASLHHAFTRELQPGARPLDADANALLCPCDAIVGAFGRVERGMALQAKGHGYPLAELLGDAALAAQWEGSHYLTLRLTAGMYHRFHAPAACRVERVDFMAGDVWNVNPAALARVPRLYCRNERAVLHCQLDAGGELLLVPVAAVLVASLRLHCLRDRLHLRYRGPARLRCRAHYARGQELGWFEQGSTIILFAPGAFVPEGWLASGQQVRMGEALYRRKPAPAALGAQGSALMQGQTVVMTGATSGIGAVTALALAAQGARLVVVARDAQRGTALLARLQALNPAAAHALHIADLGLLSQQRSVGLAIAANEPRVDVLLNNAGAVFMGPPRSSEGHAPSLALNHMAYFTLTLLLLPALRAAPAARIVCTSSRAHRYAPALPAGFGRADLQRDGIRGYALSKLANIWFTRALARRLAGTPVTANALHPGFVATRFADNTPWLWRTLMGWRKRTHGRTPEQGADTLTWLATAPELAGQSGGYWADRAPAELSALALDDAMGERLWRISAGLSGLDLPPGH